MLAAPTAGIIRILASFSAPNIERNRVAVAIIEVLPVPPIRTARQGYPYRLFNFRDDGRMHQLAVYVTSLSG